MAPHTAPLRLGAIAPHFSLSAADGTRHTLRSLRPAWVILTFYPKAGTPTCTAQVCSLAEKLLPRTANARVVAISPDSLPSLAEFSSRAPGVLLLSDPLRAGAPRAIPRYGAWQHKQLFGTKYMGVVRTTYLISPQGRVVHRWAPVRVPGHATAVLKVLHEHQTAASGMANRNGR